MEKVFEGGHQITAPCFDDKVLIISSMGSGEIFRIDQSDSNVTPTRLSGSPSSIQFNSEGLMHVADMSAKSILSFDGSELSTIVSEFEGKQFKGPNSLIFASDGTMYFTDSGPLGETTLFSPGGSLFSVDNEGKHLQPIILNSLAHPSGIALSADDSTLFVCETLQNRLLRGVQSPPGVWHFSVFHQFSGSLGPSCVALHPETQMIYVGMFDIAGPHSSKNSGSIMVLSSEGEYVETLLVPGVQITGLTFSSDARLFVTESSTNTVYCTQC